MPELKTNLEIKPGVNFNKESLEPFLEGIEKAVGKFTASEITVSKPEWWPENPYPESVFPMTLEEYIEAIPDTTLRSAVSGHLARWAWELASEEIWKRMKENINASS